MHRIIIIGVLFTSLSLKGQFHVCETAPLPFKVLTIEEEISFRKVNDSLRKTNRNWKPHVYRQYGDTSIQTKLAFKDLQQILMKYSNDEIIDSTAYCKLLFQEDDSGRVNLTDNSFHSYSLKKTDTILYLSDLYKLLRKLPYSVSELQSYSYNNQFLIIKVCDQYIGESSSWWTRKYYLKKINKFDGSR